MTKVVITGTIPAVNRHSNALDKIEDIQITGRWILSGSRNKITDAETGKTYSDPELITNQADVFIITEGGSFCNRLAVTALRKARHVYLYPSVFRAFNDNYFLIKLAREANVILKCGETGQTGISGIMDAITDTDEINLIELQHYTKISSLNLPVAVPDVLLGDIEIISKLIRARSTSIKAKGLCMISSDPELISARIDFDNGCTVNYSCNSVAPQNEHTISIVLKNRILKYNLLSGEFTRWNIQYNANIKESPIFIENIQVNQSDNLLTGLSAFFNLIRSGTTFLSMHDNGFEPVMLTDRILEKVMKTLVYCA